MFQQVSLIVFLLILPLCSAQSEEDWLPWLILAFAFAVAIVLICITAFYIRHICKKATKKRNSASESEGKKSSSRKQAGKKQPNTLLTPVVSQSGDLHDDSEVLLHSNGDNDSSTVKDIARKQVKINQLLGMGEYGPVYDGEIQLSTHVKSRTLIKVFQKGTTQDLVLFKEELEYLKKLNHPKVGQVFGLVPQRPFYALFELPINGDLKTFLVTVKTTDVSSLKPQQLVGLISDVASGIAYLQSIKFIHKDVAARSCMVTQNLTVKITDYKVGRYLFRNEYAVQADGSLLPIRWMAPETLLENHFSLQSDIWSFGVLMWEIMTMGEYPYTELSDAEVTSGVCYKFQRLLQPVECTEKLYGLMLLCWHSNPEQRPTMEHLCEQLEMLIIN